MYMYVYTHCHSPFLEPYSAVCQAPGLEELIELAVRGSAVARNVRYAVPRARYMYLRLHVVTVLYYCTHV